ncbi:MAG: hypothetical protein ABI321_02720, partial [Polyangia bacterium]
RRLQPDGSYKLVETIGPEVRSQQVLADLARRANDPKSEPLIRHVAAPATPAAPTPEPARPAATTTIT